jgi:hypothetical protein
VNRSVLLLVLVFCIFALSAQDVTPWQYVRHSAVDNNSRVHVRFNAAQDVTGGYELYGWINNSWYSMPLTSPEPLVYEALLPHSAGQTHKYRLRTSYEIEGQTVVAVNPGFLSSDAFPPALATLGYVADDPTGDSLMYYHPNLDITGTWAGWTNNKLFTAVSNVSNSFPTFNSLSSFNLYFAGIANTTAALTDSSFYAMLYTFNIPGVISSGLYKLGLNLADTTLVYEYLGPIQSQVTGGKLMMACDISTLTADPSFGTWPPPYNSLGFMAGSINVGLDLATMTPTFNVGDLSAIAQLIYEAYSYTPGTNTPPVISDVIIADNYVQFTYFDADHDFPLTAQITYDGTQVMDFIPSTPDFAQPVVMTAYNPGNWASAIIDVSDNNIDIVYHVLGTSNQDEVLPSVTVCRVYPNPFNPALGNLNIEVSGGKDRITHAAIYNLKGQLVKELDVANLAWDGTNGKNHPVRDGIYLLKISHNNQNLNRKLILIGGITR